MLATAKEKIFVGSMLAGFGGFMMGILCADAAHKQRAHQAEFLKFPQTHIVTKTMFVENGDTIQNIHVVPARIIPDSLILTIQP